MKRRENKPPWVTRVRYIVKLTDEERDYLSKIVVKGKSSAKKIMHAQILLKADESKNGRKEYNSDPEIAKMFHTTERTVIRLRKCFVEEGLESALNRKRMCAVKPRKLDGEAEAHLIALACSQAPAGYARWTLKLLADKMVELEIVDQVSKTTIGRVLKNNELKPWLKKEWCIPPKADAEFVCNMEDVLDIYKRPYDKKHPVICLDETTKQQIKEIRIPFSVTHGKPARFDTEYERNGTSNIFLGCEPLRGKRYVKITDHRKKTDFASFVKELVDVHYAYADKITLTMDNLNTHNGSSLYETFEPAEAKRIFDKLDIHYTPKHGSWLNMAEIELSHLSRQCLNRRIPDKKTLVQEVKSWNEKRNNEKVTIDWQFTTEDARIKLKKLYPVIKKE